MYSECAHSSVHPTLVQPSKPHPGLRSAPSFKMGVHPVQRCDLHCECTPFENVGVPSTFWCTLQCECTQLHNVGVPCFIGAPLNTLVHSASLVHPPVHHIHNVTMVASASEAKTREVQPCDSSDSMRILH